MTELRVDRASLEAYQAERLRETVGLARERSSFYRRHLAGAPPADELRSPADIAALPFTTAGDVRRDPLAFVCVSQGEIARVVTLDTSGTSGAPKRIFFTRDDQALTVDFFRVGMSVLARRGDRVLILLPGSTPGSVGDLLATALSNLGATPIPHGPVRDPAETLAVALAHDANVMVGIPTHLLSLVRAVPADMPRPAVRTVLLSTDHAPAAIARSIEQAWDCRVYNHYGMTEMGLGGGVDCEARRGYHLRDADMLFEVVEPVSGRPLPEGESGEIVFTTLTRHGMPLIRYRTGDLGRWLSGPCPCGTELRTLAHVTTRLDGPVHLGGGRHLTQPELDEALFPIDGVLDFATKVGPTAGIASLEVSMQITATADPARVEAAARAALAGLPAVAGSISGATLRPPQVRAIRERAAPPGPAKRSILVER